MLSPSREGLFQGRNCYLFSSQSFCVFDHIDCTEARTRFISLRKHAFGGHDLRFPLALL